MEWFWQKEALNPPVDGSDMFKRTVGGESSRVHQEAAVAAWKDTILLYLKSKYTPNDISNVHK
jgi:hypothetical protein